MTFSFFAGENYSGLCVVVDCGVNTQFLASPQTYCANVDEIDPQFPGHKISDDLLDGLVLRLHYPCTSGVLVFGLIL